MTSNQVAFFKAAEDQRHNMEAERQTAAANYEMKRHNQAMEDEAHRSNIAREVLSHESNAINRSHLANMDLENVRHNYAQEGIQRSYNSGNLAIAREANRIQSYNATTNRFNAQQNALNENRLYKMNVNESNSRILLNYSDQQLNEVRRKTEALNTSVQTVTDLTKLFTGGRKR